jgi:Holliday junction resolvase
MVNGRQKGANFEREICREIKDQLGDSVDPKRDLEQYRSADHGDILGIQGWCIECKRYSSNAGSSYKQAWLDQVFRASEATKQEPVLIYKYDRQPIKCVVRLSAINPDFQGKDDVAEVSFETWCMIVREGWSDEPRI